MFNIILYSSAIYRESIVLNLYDQCPHNHDNHENENRNDSSQRLPYPRVSNSYDQPQLPPTKMATAENGETKQSRISGKPDRALCPYDTDISVSYHTMYFSYDHVF